MRTVAISARRWLISTWIASGVRPLAAPPLARATFSPAMISGAALLYVCLHGLPNQPFWYGSDWSTAIGADQVRAADLEGAIVYLAGCYGQGPMTDALLAAGAAAVAGDTDGTWAGWVLPTGSNALGRAFVAELRRGLDVEVALDVAKAEYAWRHAGPRHAALLSSVGLAGNPVATLRRGVA